MNYDLALSRIQGIGIHTARQLVSYLGSSQQVFSVTKSKLLKVPGVGEITAEQILVQRETAMKWAAEQVNLTSKHDTVVMGFSDATFPDSLKKLPDCPMVLFKKGALDLNRKRNIAIVGTRSCTHYGIEITKKIVAELASVEHIVIYSGLAYGIDIEAHKACMEHAVPTVAVVAGGLDRIYPAAHKKYIAQISAHGAILSEYAMGVKPEAAYFPERNRIVAGMCDVVVIVEAHEKGGALITAELANSYNKEVYAVPGDVLKSASMGCNRLIQQHKARIFTTVKELTEWMQWTTDKNPVKTSDFRKEQPDIKNPEWKTIWEHLNEPKHLDELAWQTQQPVHVIVTTLLAMEFEGLVKALPGKMYARKVD